MDRFQTYFSQVTRLNFKYTSRVILDRHFHFEFKAKCDLIFYECPMTFVRSRLAYFEVVLSS